MKKTIAILLLIFLSFSCFSCKETDNITSNDTTNATTVDTGKNEPAFDDNSMLVYPDDPASFVVDYMRSMAMTEWSPKTTFNLSGRYLAWNFNLTYEAGKKYYGLPFLVDSRGTKQLFEYNLQDGIYLGGTTLSDCIGGACYDAVYVSLIQMCPSITFKSTEDMLPSNQTGLLPVGTWSQSASKHDTKAIIQSNSLGIMSKAYAQLKIGDVVLKHIVAQDAGHARIVSGDPVIVNKPDGSIDPYKSYVTTIEQTNLWDDKVPRNTTWWVDRRYTFAALYETHMVPLTPADYTASVGAPYITAKNMMTSYDAEGAAKLSGTLSSNHYIMEVSVEILDQNGSTINKQSFFPTAKHVWLEDLNYSPAIDTLSSGKYRLKIDAHLSFGTKNILDLEFEKK